MKVLLIGWDSADWALLRPFMSRGALPNLKRLLDDGTATDLLGGRPVESSLLWTSLVTGKRPTKHGILAKAELVPGAPRLSPISRHYRTAKPIWSILSENKLQAHSFGWPATAPAEKISGVMVSDEFALGGGADSIHPAKLFPTLGKMRLTPADIDEEAVRSLLPPRVPVSFPKAPAREFLAASTAIHGPATWTLENQPWDFAAIRYDGLSRFASAMNQIQGIAPPLRTAVLGGACRFMDMMLGRLMRLAGDDSAIVLVSEHGLNTQTQRACGIAVFSGSPFQEAKLPGVSIYDITPTLLELFELPTGADMDGRPCAPVLSRPLRREMRISWESGSPATAHEKSVEDPSVQYLRTLGYQQRDDAHEAAVAKRLHWEMQFRLGIAWLDADDPAQAVATLEPLLADDSASLALRSILAEAYFFSGQLSECRKLVESLIADGANTALARATLGALDAFDGKTSTAAEELRSAESMQPKDASVLNAVGRTWLRMNRPKDARRAFLEALEVDPQFHQALEGLAMWALNTGELQQTVKYAEQAITLRSDSYGAHYHLGVALLKLNKRREAIHALQRAAAVDRRGLAEVQERLAEAFEAIGDMMAGAQHRWKARQLALLKQQRAKVESNGTAQSGEG